MVWQVKQNRQRFRFALIWLLFSELNSSFGFSQYCALQLLQFLPLLLSAIFVFPLLSAFFLLISADSRSNRSSGFQHRDFRVWRSCAFELGREFSFDRLSLFQMFLVTQGFEHLQLQIFSKIFPKIC